MTASSDFVSISANDVAADADVRNPARVTPIWIVDRKLLEFAVSFITCFAFLCPSSAIFSILLSLSEIIAISLIAKNALTRTRKTSRGIWYARLP